MPAGAACAALVALICLPEPYNGATTLHASYSETGVGLAQPGVADRVGVRIDIYEPEIFFDQAPDGLSRACAGDACLVYLKVCSADGLACEIKWGQGGPRAGPPNVVDLRTLWLKAKSRQAMDVAQAAVSIRVDGGGPGGFISVASLTASATQTYLPPCDGDQTDQCADPLATPSDIFGSVSRSDPLTPVPDALAACGGSHEVVVIPMHIDRDFNSSPEDAQSHPPPPARC